MSAGSSPPTILVVDDDEGLLFLIEQALKREKWTVATASSGAAAFDWLKKKSADLMLLDLKLHDLEGHELVSALAGAGRPVPFIIITGQGDERVAVDMMKRGALDYLTKDTGMLDLLPAVVKHALEQLEKDMSLAAAQAALQESRQQILAISEREQRRFGADLHDGLGQQLTAIEFLCQSLREDLRAKQPDLEPQAEKICQFLRQTIAQTRSLARGLAPVNFESGGLMEALSELARHTAALGRVECRFDCPSPVLLEDSIAAAHLFRIAQEAVNNTLKHAQAREVVIRLSQANHALRLEVCDDGRGLAKTKKPRQGMGLQVMKHRAAVIGAELEIQSTPGQGLRVTCTLPLKP